MKAGTLLFNGTDLGLYGTPRFTLRRTPEPAAPARTTHWRIEVAVTMELTAEMPSTIWARAKALQRLLASAPEGLLEVRDENGTALSWMALPGENTLPQAIERGSGQVTLNFTATEPVSASQHPLSLRVDPLNGGAEITLSRVMSWSESVRTTRADSRLAAREEVSGTIAFTARTCYADPLLGAAARAEILHGEAARIHALSSREARLRFGGFDRTVQIESFSADPSEGWEFITVQAQARYVVLPGETRAVMKFEVDQTEDPTTGETRLVINGSVEADEEATADAKIDALVTAYRTASRRVLKVKKSNSYLDGDGEDAPEWMGLKFEIELAQGSDTARYNLKIDTKDGADGKRVTYSGSAYASTMGVLLSTVATAAAGKHPVELSSTLALDHATDDEGTETLAQASFSYEYQIASGCIRGSVERSAGNGQLGDTTASLSGSLSAPSLAIARTIARSLIPSGVLLRTDDEKQRSIFHCSHGDGGDGSDGGGPTELAVDLSFTYAWGTDHLITQISYRDSSSPDYTRMVLDRTLSGTAWSSNQATAEAKVLLLLGTLGLSSPSKASFTHSHERTAAGAVLDRWLAYDFSFTFETAITGSIGHDIIEAEWSIERTGMVNHEPMTEVPLASPVKQDPFGYNIGLLVASGSVKARQQSTARTWGQAKQAAVSSFEGSPGAADPPRERMSVIHLPFHGSTAAFYSFSFTYSYRYAAGLTGLWPSSGLTL